MTLDVNSLLSSGQLARLIPTVADSKKEERATSVLLSSLMVVPAYANAVLSGAGATVGMRSKVECYTEVAFKSAPLDQNSRPDGLIVVRNGSKAKPWSALIEAKIGNASLTNAQVEKYLDIARQHKFDAVITISNQFATTPIHHPLTISKNKTKSVSLFHFSWLSLKSAAALLTSEKGVDDPEQAYILSELVRYLDHPYSGVASFSSMPRDWSDLCSMVLSGSKLSKNADCVVNTVSAWHQLMRQLALDLGMSIGKPVTISLSNARKVDPDVHFAQDCIDLISSGSLEASFVIPNAASKLEISADIARKAIYLSMKLEAPKDTKRATASINWLVRQLRGKEELEGLSIRAHWPGRTSSTIEFVEALIDDPTKLIPIGSKAVPHHLEVVRVVELGARFKGVKTFVDDVTREVPSFYHDAGQHLNRWVAKAPKMKEEKKVQEEPSAPTIFSSLLGSIGSED